MCPAKGRTIINLDGLCTAFTRVQLLLGHSSLEMAPQYKVRVYSGVCECPFCVLTSLNTYISKRRNGVFVPLDEYGSSVVQRIMDTKSY
jgi:hypothetical protein